jgi:hypothetical protein
VEFPNVKAIMLVNVEQAEEESPLPLRISLPILFGISSLLWMGIGMLVGII